MGKVIKVTPEEMGKAAKTMRELSETYSEIYTQLFQEAGTMGTAWEGEDNLAFVEQINGFCEELRAMADKLFAVGQALEKQRANYISRQEINITQVKKLVN